MTDFGSPAASSRPGIATAVAAAVKTSCLRSSCTGCWECVTAGNGFFRVKKLASTGHSCEHANQIHKGWEPEPDAPLAVSPITGKTRLVGGSGNELPAPQGQTPTRPYHVSFDRCVGCGACEFACNQIVFGDPAMVTTSYGRGIKTKLEGEDPT